MYCKVWHCYCEKSILLLVTCLCHFSFTIHTKEDLDFTFEGSGNNEALQQNFYFIFIFFPLGFVLCSISNYPGQTPSWYLQMVKTISVEAISFLL